MEPTYFLSLWFRFKSIRFPWRRKWLVGHDLQGHTFWEFKDPLNPNRFRRIVRGPRNIHPSDYALAPSWQQWLRQARPDAPSVDEQHMEIQRQQNLVQLAARADERWRQQGSFLDSPTPAAQRTPQLESNSMAGARLEEAENKQKKNPWADADRKGPSESWKPQEWVPGQAEQRK